MNGVSLTVIGAKASGFSVGIIPHTWKHTMFYTLKSGTSVNIEVDILARYAEKLLSNSRELENRCI